MRGLNLGSGPTAVIGWVNLDRDSYPGVIQHDMLAAPLPFGDDEFDVVVAHHVLDMLTFTELLPVLSQVHRVLRKDGVLRISTPDVDRAVRRARDLDMEWFDRIITARGDAPTKLAHYLTWYGTRRTLITPWLFMDLTLHAGFSTWTMSRPGTSPLWHDALAASLDSREDESLFLEARK